MWPGNDVVDWVSWDVVQPGWVPRPGALDPRSWRPASSGSAGLFHDWLAHTRPHELGIDPGKPMMISEAGSVKDPGNPGRRATWYEPSRPFPQAPQRLKGIKAVALWDHSWSRTSCDYRFSATTRASSRP